MPFRFQAEPVKAFRYFLLFLLLVFALHLPFLDADPHVKIAFNSVDAFTDEGLYTSQLRNFINHGHLDIKESAALVKGPLFNALLLVPLWLFGTHLAVARLTLLIAGLLILLYVFRKASVMRSVLFIFCLIALMQFQVFQYMHFSIAEAVSSLCIVAGLLLLCQQFFSESQKSKSLPAALVFFAAAWYLKNAYLYAIVLTVVFVMIVPLFKGINSLSKQTTRLFFIFLGGSLLVYAVCWYLPFRDFYNYVMDKEGADRFIRKNEFWKVVKENYRYFFYSEEVKYVTYLFYFSVLITPIVWVIKETSYFRYAIICMVAWMLIEATKLTTYWVPGRYLLSGVMAMLLYISIVAAELFQTARKNRMWFTVARVIAVSIIFIVVGNNIYQYYKKLDERKYLIRNINNLLLGSVKAEETILGPWAPAFSWECKARSIPIWENYLNDVNPIERFNPSLIITDEFLEKMFEERHIDLKKLSWQRREIAINLLGRKPLTIYWLKPN
jgi:hypothetical protein